MGNNLSQNDSYDNYSYDSFVLKIRVFGGYDFVSKYFILYINIYINI